MSHFSVLLIGSKSDMERFDENNEENYYYNECTSEIIKEVEENKTKKESIKGFFKRWNGMKVFYNDKVTAKEIESKNLAEGSYVLINREDNSIIKACYWNNPNSKYDYYSTYTNDNYLIENDGANKKYFCVKDIDWDATIEKYREKNRNLYREIIGENGLFRTIPSIKTKDQYFKELKTAHPDLNENKIIRLYKEEYCNQEAVKKFNEYVKKEWNMCMFKFYLIEDYLMPEEEFVNMATLPFFAFVIDGEWYEEGEMGWWACTSNEKSKKEWVDIQNKIVNDLKTREDLQDEDVYLIDCHI